MANGENENKKRCSVPGCTRGTVGRGLCGTHYKRARRLEIGEGKAAVDGPVRAIGARVRIDSIRVLKATHAELEQDASARGVAPARIAGEVLDGWADKRRRKKR